MKVDARSKLIIKYEVTDASVNDSQLIDNLIDEEDEGLLLYADSAYTGKENQQLVKDRKMKSLI